MRVEVIVDGDCIGKTTFVSPPVAGAFIETQAGKCRIDAVTHAFGARRMRVDCTLVEEAPKPEPKPEPVVAAEEPAREETPEQAATETTEAEESPARHPLRHSSHRRRNR